jgi:GNAT superfamily N-acetyltransferase
MTAGLPPGLAIDVEPYDGPAGAELVAEMRADIDERYADVDDPPDMSPELVAHWAVRPAQMTPPVGLFAVVRDGGRPVACGGVRALLDGDPGVAEIKRMYTRPEARRRGISRALLAWLEREAALLGYRRVHLDTGGRQPEAVALYESAGYARIAPYGQYASHPISLAYGKDLPA